MKQNKNNLNKQPPAEPKEASELDVEQVLLPRLKFMGILLLFFSGCALYYSLFFATSIPSDLAHELATDQVTTPNEMEQTSGISDQAIFQLFQVERFNAYIVTFCFALVGSSCLLFVWKKKQKTNP